jgi:hypothetical protein
MAGQKRWMIVLWGGLGLLVLYQLFYGGIWNQSGKAVATRAPFSPIKVEMEQLNQPLPPPSEVAKNIFAPLPSRAPRIETPPPVFEPFPPPPPEIHVPTPEEIALEQANAALSQIRLLGFVDRGDGRQMGFFARLSETAIGGKSDLIFGHFLIRELSNTVVIVQETITRAEVTLPVSESQ